METDPAPSTSQSRPRTRRGARTTYLLIAATLCLGAWAAAAMPRWQRPLPPLTSVDPPVVSPERRPPLVTIPHERPRVEIVFALDTTSSMSGLIDGAKKKIWSIAEYLASAQPKPELRIGLVAYRDLGDAYVTRFYDLDDDLDRVFERLASFRAEGGGDAPEHVAKGLSDAVNRTSWSKEQIALKQVYLVGDAPPQHYADGLDLEKIARQANQQGIHINTIRCGNDEATRVAWLSVAKIASGEFASIGADGGVRTVATPYDARLAELNDRLTRTAIPFGRRGREVASRMDMLLGGLSSYEKAERMSAKAKGAVAGAIGRSGGDLLADDSVGDAEGFVAAAPASELPSTLGAMGPEERKKYVAAKQAERKTIEAEMQAVVRERDAWKAKNAPAAPADSFDAKVRGSIKAQAGKSLAW